VDLELIGVNRPRLTEAWCVRRDGNIAHRLRISLRPQAGRRELSFDDFASPPTRPTLWSHRDQHGENFFGHPLIERALTSKFLLLTHRITLRSSAEGALLRRCAPAATRQPMDASCGVLCGLGGRRYGIVRSDPMRRPKSHSTPP